MGSSRTSWWLVLAGAVVAACTAGAGTRDDLPPIGGGDDDDAVGDDDDDTLPQLGPMRLGVTPGLDYPMRLRETNSVDGLCEVIPPREFENYVDIECTIDINELDLYGHGLDWDLQVPANACDYLIYWHYQYEAWEVGVGPTEVSYEILGNGAIINEVNSINGDPYCIYDHTWRNPDAPDCCLGSYTKTVTDPLGVTVVSNEFWAGKPSDCYGGAAYIDPEVTNGPDGFPLAKIVYLNRAAYSKSFHFDPLSDEFYSNIPLANYYSPQDHDGDRPAGLNGLWAEPRYTFLCTDRAYEVLSEIRLTVREFNEVTQYDADGNPNTVGVEPVTGHPIDDLNDWATGTPGNVQFVEFLQ
jgi:hypothetical protein